MATQESTIRRVRCGLPAVLMRAGTSKGLFIHRHDLPVNTADWEDPLLAAMGSQNADARQIDGIGGATSVTSKVAVVSPSSRPDADVDYTFVQVAVGTAAVDFTGNCGNMCSGVGPFALQEGLVRAEPGQRSIDVRIFNTNTSRLIVERLEVDDEGSFREDGDHAIAGVKGTGSKINVSFVDPAGSMTGQLFPSGNRSDTLKVRGPSGSQFSVKATLIDAANPFVVVNEASLPRHLRNTDKVSESYLEEMESIRRVGAVMMGLASSTEQAGKSRGTPKLAIVSPRLADGVNAKQKNLSEIQVLAFSMGKPHPSLQLTGAACLASATCIEGTVAHLNAALAYKQANWEVPSPERTPSPMSEEDDYQRSTSRKASLVREEAVCISHPTGQIHIDVTLSSNASTAVVDRCTVTRTARRIFEGKVYYYQNAA